jgi:hypothetical protein
MVVDARSDIFAAGAVFLKVVPFRRAKIVAILDLLEAQHARLAAVQEPQKEQAWL